jgi:sugar/nucleoside kinase (ribokinase family)
MPLPHVDVVGVGENSIDYVYRLPQLPRTGGASKIEIAESLVSPGGQVTTTLCACAALGLSTSYLGAFGRDDKAALIRDVLAQRGVDVSHARTCDAGSRYAVILVEEGTGERVVLWHREPALALSPADLPREPIRGARLLHVDGVDEDVAIAAAGVARAAGIPVTSDIDRVTARTPDLIAAVTVPILAEGVAEALTGEHDLERALRALRRRHPGWLCVTRGARGAVLLDGDTLHEVDGHPVAAVDTTGAGDVFRGAFIYALLRGDGPSVVLRFANAAAAISCTRLGAIASVPRREEVDAMSGKLGAAGSVLRGPS